MLRKLLKRIKDYTRLKSNALLKANKELKDKYKGKRCFVVGNGPSLKKMDLTPLKNEFTFCVNMIYKTDQVDVLNPDFYSEIEPLNELLAFPKDHELYLDNYYKEINKNIIERFNPICFFRSEYAPIIKTKGIKDDSIYYVESLRPLNDSMDIHNRVYGDLTMPNSFMDGVIYNAVNACVYMGFSEIYIIGCDMNHILTGGETHAYDNDETVERTRRTNKQNALGLYKALIRWEIVDDFCKKNGVKLFNAGIDSMVDNIRPVKFSNLFKGI